MLLQSSASKRHRLNAFGRAGYIINTYGRALRNLIIPSHDNYGDIQISSRCEGKRDSFGFNGHNDIDLTIREGSGEHSSYISEKLRLSEHIGHIQIAARQYPLWLLQLAAYI
ncbi:hypothetical protein D3C78_718660 [compost metagenome]